jgi:hypothetical protein
MWNLNDPFNIVHLYVEILQETPWVASYLYLKQAKMSLFSFFLYKIGEQVLLGGERWYQKEEGGGRKGCRRVNMLQVLCTHVCKCKNDTC